MTVKILFFGILSDKSGETEIHVSEISDLNSLLSDIRKRFPSVADMKFTVARNKEVIRENILLENGDEIALLPPFAGG